MIRAYTDGFATDDVRTEAYTLDIKMEALPHRLFPLGYIVAITVQRYRLSRRQ